MVLRDDTWHWLQPALQDMRSGTDRPWEERRARFVEQLGLSGPDQHPVVAELLHRLDELPDQERAATLDSDWPEVTAYELLRTLVTEPDDQDEAGAHYDDQAWQTFLAANAFAWNGTAGSWAAFGEWFEYHAAEQGLAGPAAALLRSMETQSPDQRVATFASYGVTIAAPATGHAEETPSGGDFDWVTPEQAGHLTELLGAGWQVPLDQELTTRWGSDWRAHPAAHKTAWLDDLIESGGLRKSPEEQLDELDSIIDSIPDYKEIAI